MEQIENPLHTVLVLHPQKGSPLDRLHDLLGKGRLTDWLQDRASEELRLSTLGVQPPLLMTMFARQHLKPGGTLSFPRFRQRYIAWLAESHLEPRGPLRSRVIRAAIEEAMGRTFRANHHITDLEYGDRLQDGVLGVHLE